MGLFDRFRKGDELAFEAAGEYETASCPGKRALTELNRLRDEGRARGFSAILLGGKNDLDGLVENRELSGTSVEDNLRLAGQVDVNEWLKTRVEQDTEYYSAEVGEWPSAPAASGGMTAHLEILSGKPKDLVYLAKIPTAKNWEVPAYIGLGGWNACPDACVITAFAKHWYERYGAEVVSMTHDVVEFNVANPPRTREAAMELAKEQYIFCGDIVDQGVGSVSALAATLLNSNYWYFWWD
jgi:hypothetical protein